MKGTNLLVAKDDEGGMEIWSSGSDDEEMMRPTHGAMFARDANVRGRCFMVRSNDSESSNYRTNSMSSGYSQHSSCVNTKCIPVSSAEKVVEKVRFIFNANSVSSSLYDPLLNKLLDNFSSLGSSVAWNINKVEDLEEKLEKSRFACEEKRVRIEQLELREESQIHQVL